MVLDRWLVILSLGAAAVLTACTSSSGSKSPPTTESPYAVGSSSAYNACSKMEAIRQDASSQTLAVSDLPSKLEDVIGSATNAANVNPVYSDLLTRAQQARAAVLNNDPTLFTSALQAFSNDCTPVLSVPGVGSS